MNQASRANPFKGHSPEQIYDLLTRPDPAAAGHLPRWPDLQTQKQYNTASGPLNVRRSQYFIDMLDADGAFVPGWKGLDYGCGWGRIASLMLTKGSPQQLDLCDAWSRSLDLIRSGNFANAYWRVSEVLKPGDVPANTYSFIYAFSVFTHLQEDAFWSNIVTLLESLQPAGRLYFTVRHPDFIASRSPEKVDAIRTELFQSGLWFTPTKGNFGPEPVFGETIVDPEYLISTARQYGDIRYLGSPRRSKYQHLYALSRA